MKTEPKTQQQAMSNKEYWTIVICLLLGFAMGYFFKSQSMDNFNILYIAKDELIKLEQERINKSGGQDLFFGELDKAIDLTNEIATGYESANTKVVFSLGVVSGSGTRSIAKEIHQEIIERLVNE